MIRAVDVDVFRSVKPSAWDIIKYDYGCDSDSDNEESRKIHRVADKRPTAIKSQCLKFERNSKNLKTVR